MFVIIKSVLRRSTTETIGWVGVIAIICAYASLNFGILSQNSLVYLLLNVLGSIGIIIDASRQKDYQPLVLNILWAVIAVFAIIKTLI